MILRRKSLCLLIFTAFLWLLPGLVFSNNNPHNHTSKFSKKLIQPSAPKWKAQNLGPRLKKISRTYRQGGKGSARRLMKQLKMRRTHQNMVPVILEVEKGRQSKRIALHSIRALGGKFLRRSRSFIQVEVPVDKLDQLTDIPGIINIRAPLPKKEFAIGLGDSVSQAVALTGADNYQTSGYDGTGIKVAVLDFGYIGLSAAVAAGEIPAGYIGMDFTGRGLQTDGNHGTLVAEHVMDMAPGATLFCMKVETSVDIENAVDTMAARGIKVANFSVGWYQASYYDDTGPFNDAVNDGRDNHNIFFSASAGNESDRHWRGGWVDGDGDGILNFDVSDEDLSYSGSGDVYLNWDQYSAAVTDLDLLIIDKDGVRVDSSISSQTGGPNQSYESVHFTYDAAKAPYHIIVSHFSGSLSGLDLTIYIGDGSILDHPMAGNAMTDPASAHGAFTVGAVYQGDWALSSPPIQSFSSHGRTNDGRLKPDIVAPDGGRNFTETNVTGTSFAAPIVAGAAVLLLHETLTMTANGVDSSLKDSAIDVGIAGADSVYGYGKLKITPVNFNRTPVLSPIGDQSIPENIAWQLEIVSLDPDGDPVTLTHTTLPTGATFVDSGNGNGTLFWTPTHLQAGTYPLTITTTDTNSLQDQESITITVTDANVVPVIDSQTATLSTPEEQSLTITSASFAITDLDHPTGPWTVTIYSGSNYTAIGNQLTPVAEFNGVLTVPLVVYDGTDSSAVFNASVTVTAVNDTAIIFGQQTLSIVEDSSITMTLSQLSVSDTDNTYPDDFTIHVRDGINYTHVGNVVTPVLNFNGVLVVGVAVHDGTDSSATAGIGVTVTAVNDAPTIIDQSSLFTFEEVPILVSLAYLAGSDPDNNFPDDFTLVLKSGSNYTVTDTTVTPNQDFVGQLSVPTILFDGTDSSNTWPLLIDVFAVNDPPVFTTTPGDLTPTGTQDQLYTDTVVGTDIEGDSVFYFLLPGAPLTASMDSVTGILTWTPSYSDTGLNVVSLIAWDGAAQDTLTFNITVANVNDLPIFTGSINTSALEDFPWTDTIGTVDFDGDSVTMTMITSPAGMAFDSTTGIMTWTPTNADTGDHTVSIEADDGTGKDTASFVITVQGTNDAPTFTTTPGEMTATVDQDGSYLDTVVATDIDGDIVNYFLLNTSPQMNLDSVSGILSWTPIYSDTGVHVVSVVAVDQFFADTLIFVLTVNNINDVPIFTGNINTLAIQDQLWEDTVGAVDFDGDSVTFSKVSGPPAFNIDPITGIMTWTPVNADTGDHDVTLEAFDGIARDSVTLTITVLNVNDAPVISTLPGDITSSVNQGALFLDTIAASDIDGDTLKYFILPGAPAIAIDTLAGIIGWIPTNADTGQHTVSVLVHDGFRADTLTFNLTVNNVNDAPVIDSIKPAGDTSMAEGDSLLFQVFTTDIDVGDSVTYIWALNGQTVGTSDTYWRVPDYASAGIDTLSLTVSDGDTSIVLSRTITVSNTSVPPNIQLPNGANLTKDSNLTWPDVTDPDMGDSIYYTVELSLDPNFGTILASMDSLRDKSILIDSLLNGATIDSNATVYWRLKAGDDQGYETDFTDGSNNFVLVDGGKPTPLGLRLPDYTFISGNTPNPFTAVTNLSYGIAKADGASKVTLKIFDVKGNHLSTLVNGFQAPGFYTVSWNSGTHASGIYFYQIHIGSKFFHTQKMFKRH